MRRTLALAALLGAVIGALSGVYLLVVRWSIDLIWDGTRPRLPGPGWLTTIVVCVLGGLVVGLLRRRHDDDAPHDLDDALVQLDTALETEAAPVPSVRWLVRAAVLGVVSLAAGASLGPEAPLIVLATGLGQRSARILRITRSEAAYVSVVGALSGLLGGPLGAVVMPVEHAARPARATRLIGPGLVAGVTGLLALLLVLPDGGGLRYDLPAVDLTGRGSLVAVAGWAALAALLGAVAGLGLRVGAPPLRHWAERVMPSTMLRAAAGGLVLGGCGALAPLTLFSGEHEVEHLAAIVASSTALGLLALAALKVVASLAVQVTGWFGGQIFPAAFAGMAAGLVVVAATGSAPVTVALAAGAGSATAVVLRPLAALLVLLLFLPVAAALPLTVGVAVGALAAGLLGDRLPALAKAGGAH
jgi:H+/Cl- antiporter ClcA